MKRCPQCGFETADSEKRFCPYCSNVRLETVRSQKESGSHHSFPSGVNATYGTDNDPRIIAESIAAAMSTHKTPIVDGDANVIPGGIYAPDTGDKTFHVQIKELSEAERLHKNRVAFHDACAGFVDNGHISDEGHRQLNAIRESLGLHRDIADSILKDVLKQSIRKRTGLPGTAKVAIEIAKEKIALNDVSSINNALSELSALRLTVDDDRLDQIYFQLKAILTPKQYVNDYSSTHEKSYWETYWCHVALIRTEPDKAEESLAELVHWDSYYPYQDQAIIQTIGYLMQDKELEARIAYRYISPGYSSDLEPIRFVLGELLDKDWYEFFEVSPSVQFYVDALFKATYARKREQAETNKAKEIAARMDRERVQEEIAYKKGRFLVEYEKKEGSIPDALDYSGATQMEYQAWKRSDVDFNLSIEDINQRIAEKRDKEACIIEEQKSAFLAHYESDKGSIDDALKHSGVDQYQVDKWKGVDSSFRKRIADIDARLKIEREEEERVIYEKKEHFIAAYKSNKCDIQKTCSDLELSPETVNSWRKTDNAFDNRLSFIDRERRKKIFITKVLPCVTLLLLITFIVLKLISISNERQLAKEVSSRYSEITSNLKGIIDIIPDDIKDISIEKHYDALVSGVDSLKFVIELENDPHFTGEEESSELREILLHKAKIIRDYSINLTGTPSAIPKYDSIRTRAKQYVINIDSLTQRISK